MFRGSNYFIIASQIIFLAKTELFNMEYYTATLYNCTTTTIVCAHLYVYF